MEASTSYYRKDDRVGIGLIVLGIVGYITALVFQMVDKFQPENSYVLVGSHIFLAVGLMLFSRPYTNWNNWRTKLVVTIAFLTLTGAPIFLFLTETRRANNPDGSELIVYRKQGSAGEVLLDLPENESTKATFEQGRKVKSYQLMATVDSKAHLIITFHQGEPETIGVDLPHLSAFEAVLKQPDVHMYVEGPTKTFMPSNLKLKSF